MHWVQCDAYTSSRSNGQEQSDSRQEHTQQSRELTVNFMLHSFSYYTPSMSAAAPADIVVPCHPQGTCAAGYDGQAVGTFIRDGADGRGGVSRHLATITNQKRVRGCTCSACCLTLCCCLSVASHVKVTPNPAIASACGQWPLSCRFVLPVSSRPGEQQAQMRTTVHCCLL